MTVLLDFGRSTIPALVALFGVWLGAGLSRGRERRAWRRDRLVSVCSSFIDATAAVEQWGVSAQFAGRLAAGQYPTEYKSDLGRMAAAVAAVSISSPLQLRELAAEAEKAVREFVTASAEQEANRAARVVTTDSIVAAARERWYAARAGFLQAARDELDTVK